MSYDSILSRLHLQFKHHHPAPSIGTKDLGQQSVWIGSEMKGTQWRGWFRTTLPTYLNDLMLPYHHTTIYLLWDTGKTVDCKGCAPKDSPHQVTLGRFPDKIYDSMFILFLAQRLGSHRHQGTLNQ